MYLCHQTEHTLASSSSPSKRHLNWSSLSAYVHLDASANHSTNLHSFSIPLTRSVTRIHFCCPQIYTSLLLPRQWLCFILDSVILISLQLPRSVLFARTIITSISKQNFASVFFRHLMTHITAIKSNEYDCSKNHRCRKSIIPMKNGTFHLWCTPIIYKYHMHTLLIHFWQIQIHKSGNGMKQHIFSCIDDKNYKQNYLQRPAIKFNYPLLILIEISMQSIFSSAGILEKQK